MGMMNICPACGSDWCVNAGCIREKLGKKIEQLSALLQESKRKHYHCDDSWYCCGKCDSEDHFGGHPSTHDGESARISGVCNCGADEWNTRIDTALSKE
jgi:hypothetical protein